MLFLKPSGAGSWSLAFKSTTLSTLHTSVFSCLSITAESLWSSSFSSPPSVGRITCPILFYLEKGLSSLTWVLPSNKALHCTANHSWVIAIVVRDDKHSLGCWDDSKAVTLCICVCMCTNTCVYKLFCESTIIAVRLLLVTNIHAEVHEVLPLNKCIMWETQ